MDINFSRPQFTPSSSRTWPEVLTLEQTAQILGVSKWSLRKWDNEGKFKAVRVGSHRRYRKEDVINATQNGI
jgi:excisionase family DNA binding protein